MNTTMLSRARKHFNSEYVAIEINRANRRKWVRSLRYLGSNWLLHPNNAIKGNTHKEAANGSV